MMSPSVILLLGCLGSATADEKSLLPAIRTAYEANRALFSFGTIRFLYAVGWTDDTSAARRGEWSKTAETEALYVFNGPSAYYERIFNPVQMARHRRKIGVGRYTTTLSSMRVLTDGKYTLWDHVSVDEEGKKQRHTAQIDAGTHIFYQYFQCPLNLGQLEPQGFDLETVP